MYICSTHGHIKHFYLPNSQWQSMHLCKCQNYLLLCPVQKWAHFLFTFLCYANKRWLARRQPVDKSPLQYISINAHLQGKQFLWFSAEIRVGCQFEVRVQHTDRLLMSQAASTCADHALIYAHVNLKWLSWSHYCDSRFTLGRKQEQNMSQDHNISRLICPLYMLAASGTL